MEEKIELFKRILEEAYLLDGEPVAKDSPEARDTVNGVISKPLICTTRKIFSLTRRFVVFTREFVDAKYTYPKEYCLKIFGITLIVKFSNEVKRK